MGNFHKLIFWGLICSDLESYVSILCVQGKIFKVLLKIINLNLAISLKKVLSVLETKMVFTYQIGCFLAVV